MSSNCHLEAEARYQSGEAEWICFRRTRMSKMALWQKNAPLSVQVIVGFIQVLILYPIGHTLNAISGLLMHLGEFCLTWGWRHASWINFRGEHWEYVPKWKCDPRWAPPVLFDGHSRKVAGKE